MDHLQGNDRDQLTLFPEALDDYISQENPVRFINAYVDSLDLGHLGFRHAVLQETGRPPYHPGDLLKLYLYGYLNRVRASRQLEREAQRNVEVMWLLRRRGIHPRHLIKFQIPDLLLPIAPHRSPFTVRRSPRCFYGVQLDWIPGRLLRDVMRSSFLP